MKTTAKEKAIVKIGDIINDIKSLGRDGFLFIGTIFKRNQYISLIAVHDGVLKTFTASVRKQGSGKREQAQKVRRFYTNKCWWIITPDFVEETDISEHTFCAIPTDKLVKEKFIEVFRAKMKYSDPGFCTFRNLFKYSVNKITEKEIEEEEITAPAEEPAAPAEEPTAPAEEPAAPKTEEDLMIDWMVDLDTKSTNPFTKGFLNRMMDVSSSIDKSLIEEVDKFDCSYRHAQEICQSLMESIKTVQNATTAAENIDRFILALSAISADLKAQAEKEETIAQNLKRSLENVTENRVRYFYNGIDCRLSIIEEENNEQKKAVAKVNDIMANLTDVERDLLMKSLGLKPEVEIIEDPVPVPDTSAAAIEGNKFVIIMNDGNTRSIEKNWSEIAHHLRQVALKKETVNISICEYVASEMKKGMSRKDLGEHLGSNHYATKILDYCSQLGLYKIDKNLNPKRYSPEAAAKAGKTRSTLSKLRKKAIDEDLAKHAANRG